MVTFSNSSLALGLRTFRSPCGLSAYFFSFSLADWRSVLSWTLVVLGFSLLGLLGLFRTACALIFRHNGRHFALFRSACSFVLCAAGSRGHSLNARRQSEREALVANYTKFFSLGLPFRRSFSQALRRCALLFLIVYRQVL